MLILDHSLLLALGYSDGDINTAPFDNTDIITGYKDALKREYLNKLGNNNCYNYRHSGQMMVIDNQRFAECNATGTSLTYDTERAYENKYVECCFYMKGSSISLPRTIAWSGDYLTFTPVLVQLTTSFQEIISDIAFFQIVPSYLCSVEIRAVASGGIQIRISVTGVSQHDVYLLGTMKELRQIIGA